MRGYGLLLLTSTLFAVPASAQFYPAPGPGPRRSPPMIATTVSKPAPDGPQLGSIFSDIDAGRRTGQLSHKQAKELRLEAGEISALEARYAADGLSDSEAAELQTRTEVLRSIINAKRSGVLK